MTLITNRVWRWAVAAFTGMFTGWMAGSVAQAVYAVPWMVIVFSAGATVSGSTLSWAWLVSVATRPLPADTLAARIAVLEGDIAGVHRRITIIEQTAIYGAVPEQVSVVATLRERVCRVEDRLVAVETRRAERR